MSPQQLAAALQSPTLTPRQRASLRRALQRFRTQLQQAVAPTTAMWSPPTVEPAAWVGREARVEQRIKASQLPPAINPSQFKARAKLPR